MSERVYDIHFDFSNFIKDKKCTLKVSNQTPLNDIIKALKLNDELKSIFETNNVSFYVNGNKIDGKLSLTENNIKDGETITISKLINKKRLRVSKLAILNENENYNESENAFNMTEKIEKKDKKENENDNNNDINITKIKKEEFMKKSKCSGFKNICNNNKMKLIIFLLIPLILTSIILLIILTRGDNNNTIENKDIKYENEKLISKLEYRVNQIYTLLYKKETINIYEPINMTDLPYENKTFNFTEYIHYTLGIEKENYEKDEEIKIQKKYYNAFLAINNITTENKTDIVTNLYLTNINELNHRFLQNVKKSRNLNQKQMIMNINDLDNFTQPIIKFDFYQNGDIK